MPYIRFVIIPISYTYPRPGLLSWKYVHLTAWWSVNYTKPPHEKVGAWMATLSIASAKGGVGKTTVAIAVSAELALDGYRLASEWGAVTTVPSPKPVIASLRLEIPEYLDRQLAQAAFDQRVTTKQLDTSNDRISKNRIFGLWQC